MQTITKEQFEAYNKAMSADNLPTWATYSISVKSGLSYEEVKFITSNYNSLKEKYVQ